MQILYNTNKNTYERVQKTYRYVYIKYKYKLIIAGQHLKNGCQSCQNSTMKKELLISPQLNLNLN